ncbi:ABC transporter ATP-binding protein [Demequina sp.]|uniref:ABC transporter ATP-binding protein n=1 Tax=Demequina sp. TaxID=2050685 RepID=UPI003D103867
MTAVTTASGMPGALAASQVADPILEIRDLTVEYGFGENPVRVLDHVNLTLGRGELLGLAGESGCGKSTLAYGATRLLPPPGVIRSGEVIFRGRDRDAYDILELRDKDLRAARWRDFAIVFQGAMNSLNPVHRLGDQIMDAVKAHQPKVKRAEARDRAAYLLDMVGISTDRMKAYPHQLSGGMRQRAMIATALALEPELLIMDEPTTALDVVMQRQILEEIADLRQRLGFSVIFITHDVSLLVEVADRIAIMYAGEIVEQAGAQDAYRRPRHPYTKGLLSSFPPLRGARRELGGIPGSPPDLAALPAGCPFAARCPHAFDRCRVEDPVLGPTAFAATEPTRLVACHLHTDPGVEVPAELALR